MEKVTKEQGISSWLLQAGRFQQLVMGWGQIRNFIKGVGGDNIAPMHPRNPYFLSLFLNKILEGVGGDCGWGISTLPPEYTPINIISAWFGLRRILSI